MRAELAGRRRRMGPEARARAGQRVVDQVLASPLWAASRAVALYHAMPEEVPTAPLLEAAWASGRRVALPVTPPRGNPLVFRWVTPESRLIRAHFGALEPSPQAPEAAPGTVELVVVPGLGFDPRCARLGYGGGYYDRTLTQWGPSLMVAFDCQQVEAIPEEPHDVRVGRVITESRPWSPAGG